MQGAPILMDDLSSRLYGLRDKVPPCDTPYGLTSCLLRLLRCEEPLWKILVDGGMRAGLGRTRKWETSELAAILKKTIEI
jgi:hypothetical protein